MRIIYKFYLNYNSSFSKVRLFFEAQLVNLTLFSLLTRVLSLQFRRPNEALLSINCFQKDLGDTNPLVRAWALRTMAGIRLHVIAPIVLVAVGKCARDPSVFVRKCAANALPKLHDLRQEENTETIEEVSFIFMLISGAHCYSRLWCFWVKEIN